MSTKIVAAPEKKMSDVSVQRRIIAYVLILAGYFLYCYNSSVLDYVKPFLSDYYNIGLEQSAVFYSYQTIGTVTGAFVCAWLAENWGKKKTLICITLLNGLATVICLTYIEFHVWCGMRFLVGISLGGYYTAAVSSMVGLFSDKVRGMVTAIAYSMYSFSIIAIGAFAAMFKEAGWENLIWIGGIPPMIVALLMVLLVPNEEKYKPFGNQASGEAGTNTVVAKGTWREMFSKDYIKITVAIILMAALNSIGFQFFSGFVTVYLREVRMFDAVTMGAIYSLSSFGNLVGAYAWGFLSDKFGRKFNAFGFFLSALMVVFYFISPSNMKLLALFGAIYNFGLASTSIWGGYFTELFPQRLRSMGASLFHVAKILSFMSPYVIVMIKNATSLTTAMWGAPIVFSIVGIIWLCQPETNRKGIFYKGYVTKE
ncbi:MFS transporter [Clostridiales bacterium TF09-2AC]|nr:MFS transporter [Clostridiales bacterium TF09-2AC]